MPHVELSIVEGGRRLATPRPGSLARWASVVGGAEEPCLVLDAAGTIVVISPSCASLLGLDSAAAAANRPLREALAELVDFSESLDRLDRGEADKIPPLLAISSGRLARGLLRVACPDTGVVCTMDAIAAPLRDGDDVVGSISFFSRI